MAEPDDIAASVLILAADQAGWITGQTIMANGGNSFGLRERPQVLRASRW